MKKLILVMSITDQDGAVMGTVKVPFAVVPHDFDGEEAEVAEYPLDDSTWNLFGTDVPRGWALLSKDLRDGIDVFFLEINEFLREQDLPVTAFSSEINYWDNYYAARVEA